MSERIMTENKQEVHNMSYGYGGFGNNGFILLVVLFVLLVIVGNNYPMGQGYGK